MPWRTRADRAMALIQKHFPILANAGVILTKQREISKLPGTGI